MALKNRQQEQVKRMIEQREATRLKKAAKNAANRDRLIRQESLRIVSEKGVVAQQLDQTAAANLAKALREMERTGRSKVKRRRAGTGPEAEAGAARPYEASESEDDSSHDSMADEQIIAQIPKMKVNPAPAPAPAPAAPVREPVPLEPLPSHDFLASYQESILPTNECAHCVSAAFTRTDEECARAPPARDPGPFAEFRKSLPVAEVEAEFVEKLLVNDVMIVTGSTGSGKTTQIPQFLFEYGFGTQRWPTYSGRVAVTEPRRIAATSMAERVSQELGMGPHGENHSLVGHHVRNSAKIPTDAALVFMTDGLLLRQAQSDPLLRQYSCIVVDEAHERRANSDVLVGLLSRAAVVRRRCWEQRRLVGGQVVTPLKLIVMSATLNLSAFAENSLLFGPAAGFGTLPPVVGAEGRLHPVTVHMCRETPADYVQAAASRALRVHREERPGTILVFLSGQKECETAAKLFREGLREGRVRRNLTPRSNETTGGVELTANEEKLIATAAPAEAVVDEAEDGADGNDNGQQDNNQDDFDVAEANDNLDEVEDDNDEAFTFTLGGNNTPAPGAPAAAPAAPTLSGAMIGDELAAALLSGRAAGEKAVRARRERVIANDRPTTARVLTLYSSLPEAQQARVLTPAPEGTRMVVFTTNVAESSLTLPDVRYVVDAGREKRKEVCPHTGAAQLSVRFISRASADQRAGRAGRVAPGTVWRLYSPGLFGCHMAPFAQPEIETMPADSIVLTLKALGIEHVDKFPFPTSPPLQLLRAAELALNDLALLRIDPNAPVARITPQGRRVARLPTAPRYGRMLCIASHSCEVDMPANCRSRGPAPANGPDQHLAARTKVWTLLAHAISVVAMLSPAQPIFVAPPARPPPRPAGESEDDYSSDDSSDDEYEMHPVLASLVNALPEEVELRFGSLAAVRNAALIAHASDFGHLVRLMHAYHAFVNQSAAKNLTLSELTVAFCNRYHLAPKAFEEAVAVRDQLARAMAEELELAPFAPSPQALVPASLGRDEDAEARALRKICAATFVDQLLRRATRAVESTGRFAYELRVPIAVEATAEDVEEGRSLLRHHAFVHFLSCCNGLADCEETWPRLLAYGSIYATQQVFVRFACAVEPEWLADIATPALLQDLPPPPAALDTLGAPLILPAGERPAAPYQVYFVNNKPVWLVNAEFAGGFLTTAVQRDYPQASLARAVRRLREYVREIGGRPINETRIVWTTEAGRALARALDTNMDVEQTLQACLRA